MTARIAGTREAAKMMRALLAASLCAGWVLHGISLVHAQSQTYPNRPIKMIVPFPAGGPTDGMARIISDRLGAVLGQSIVVENRGGGAGGSIGAKAVATADPDGYTILITPGGALTTGPAVHQNIGYDPAKVFAPVGLLIETPLIMAVHPDLPVKSLAEVVAYAKANPGKISWGSQGFGTAPHLLAELFKLEAGVNIVHVPYRGTAPMLAAVVAGEVQMVADPSTTSLPHIQSGQAAPAGGRRRRTHSEIAGRADHAGGGLSRSCSAPFWLGVVAPAGTPPRHHRQAQRRVPRKPRPAGDARAARHARRRDQDRHAGRVRQDARRRARAVDRRREGRQHQGGMKFRPPQHRNFIAMFRRDAPAEAEFRMEVRTWLEANLPVALRGRTIASAARGADALVSHALAQRLGRAALAQAIWRNGRHAQRTDHHDGGAGAHRRTASAGSRSQSHRPDHHGVRERRAEGATSAAHHCRHIDLGAGLFRAGRGLRPCQPGDPRNAGGRSFRGAGAQDLDDLGASFGLDVRAGAHRSAGPAAAGRHQLPADRSAQPGHQDQADQDDRGR